MANPSIAQAVNRGNTGKALAMARRECGGDKAWLNALNRAALNLEACRWEFDGETLEIHSATQDMTYIVTNLGCDSRCKAFEKGIPCWHRAARRLLLKAAAIGNDQTLETCPMCGAPIEGKQYYVAGRGYIYFDVCNGDGQHHTRKLV